MRLRSTTGAQSAVVVAAAVAGALIAWTGGGSAATEIRYQTTPASLTTVTDRISATGTVTADNTVALAFGTSSNLVTAVDVHPGDSVTEGQLLATVDDTAAQAALTAAEAQLALATAQAAAPTPTPAPTTKTACLAALVMPAADGATVTAPPAESPTPSPSEAPSRSPSPAPSRPPQPTRPPTPSSAPSRSSAPTRSLMSTNCPTSGTSAPSSNGNSSRSTGSTVSLTDAQAQVDTAQAAIDATRLVAPQDAVVTTVNLTAGTLPSTPAIELRTTGYSIQVPVAEQDAPYVAAGQTAQVTYTALGISGAGTVVATPLQPSSSGGTLGVVSYPVTVNLTNAPPGLLPGMSAQVSWTAVSKDNTLAVPTGAIQGSDNGDVVRVLVNGVPAIRPVQLGLSTSSLTEVMNGVKPGDLVITGVQTG